MVWRVSISFLHSSQSFGSNAPYSPTSLDKSLKFCLCSPLFGFATAFLPSNILCPSESNLRGVSGFSIEHVTDVMSSSSYKNNPHDASFQSQIILSHAQGDLLLQSNSTLSGIPDMGLVASPPLLLSIINICNLYICCLLKMLSSEESVVYDVTPETWVLVNS